MLQLSCHGHAGQYRASLKKDQSLPYIVHPVGVALLVIKYFPVTQRYLKDNLETLINVALAHDLLEDTLITSNQIADIGGERVSRLVESMTKLPNQSKDLTKRNEEIKTRTINAGPSALYIRLCDNLHNYSWHHMTPNTLLRKALSRADDVYLPILKKIKMGDELTDTYKKRVGEIKTYLENVSETPTSLSVPKTMEEAIRLCSIFTHEKLLKIHDIIDKLYSITGAENVSIWLRHGQTEKFFRPAFFRGKEIKLNDNIKEGKVSVLSKEPTLEEVKRFIPNPSHSERYFILALPISSRLKYLILFTFKKNKIPNWITLVNLEFLVKSLSERFIVANNNYKRELISLASSLNMSFEVDWADNMAVEPTNIIELHKWKRRCEQAIRQVRHACELLLEQNMESDPMCNLIKIESRIKGTRSTVRKFLPPSKLEWPKFEQLPDIAGVRVICPTKKWISVFKKYLLGSKVRSLGIKPHPKYEIKDYTRHPTARGYRALHLVLAVETILDGKKINVPCEVQLQTMIQDVWAKISHLMTYKNEEDALRRELKTIGENLDSFDTLVEQIAKKTT
ncbi:MAG TPA: HD domain-containing protein [Candidatus Paceibacterota bacterium]|nr:HD domain-containing protein [Candidatus Paceibacterota bacterium]